jgi:hypothetical protein
MGGDDLEEIKDEGPRSALIALFKDIENGNMGQWCKMYPPHAYSLEDDVITLSDETMIKACEEEMAKLLNLDFWKFAVEDGKLRYTINSYKDVKIDEVVASNSGPTYEVTAEIEICGRIDSAFPWNCAVYSIENSNELVFYFTEVSSQWIDVTKWMDQAETEDKPFSLEDAFNDFLDSVNNRNWKEYCKYISLTVDDENNIILANNTELNECVEEVTDSFEDDSPTYKATASKYSEEKLDYKAADNSGMVHSVNVTIEDCYRNDELESWDCEESERVMTWVKVSGQWLWWNDDFIDEEESAPIASFFVTQDSLNVYHVNVVKVTKQENLEDFSFF